MPTNNYFNFFPGDSITSEQLLVEDLVIEAMKIHGMDVYYLPRSTRDNETEDFLYGEDTTKQYREAYVIEMYLENTSAMEGEGDFISKFGLEIRDETSLLVSRRRFKIAKIGGTRPYAAQGTDDQYRAIGTCTAERHDCDHDWHGARQSGFPRSPLWRLHLHRR